MLVHLMLSQRSLRLSSILFLLFSLFYPEVVISTILSSRSLIRSSASVILALIPSREFLISFIVLFIIVCLLFTSSRSLLNVSYIFSILFPRFRIIFTIITLKSFSGRLPNSSTFVRSGEFLPCSFICWFFLCLLILLNLLCFVSPFCRPLIRTSRFFCLFVFFSFLCVCLFLFARFCFYYLPWALFVWFFFSFLPRHVACRVFIPRPEVGPEPLWWEPQIQATGLPENFRPNGILIAVSSPRGPHLGTKTQLHPTACKLQCWTPQAKQPARKEHSPTHQQE